MNLSSQAPFEEDISVLLRETIESGASIHLNVISQSMSPLLQSGDAVIVEHVTQDEYHPGDMIVFEEDGSLITHRLIAKRETHWLSKGDNALNPDPPLNPDHVLGKVSAIQKHGDCIQVRSATHFRARSATHPEGDTKHFKKPSATHPEEGAMHFVEMRSRSWQRTNRALAKINLCQIHLIRIVDQITSRVFGERQIRGVSLLHRLLAAPFRLLSKILIQFGVKNSD